MVGRSMNLSSLKLLCLHAGYGPDATGSRVTPLYRTSPFVFKSTEHAAKLFALAELKEFRDFTLGGLRTYLRSGWNILDFIIVMISILGLFADLIPAFGKLKSLRILRVLRPLLGVLRPLLVLQRVQALQHAPQRALHQRTQPSLQLCASRRHRHHKFAVGVLSHEPRDVEAVGELGTRSSRKRTWEGRDAGSVARAAQTMRTTR